MTLETLKQAVESGQVTQAQLVKASGLRSNVVHQVVKGKRRNPSYETVTRLLKALATIRSVAKRPRRTTRPPQQDPSAKVATQ